MILCGLQLLLEKYFLASFFVACVFLSDCLCASDLHVLLYSNERTRGGECSGNDENKIEANRTTNNNNNNNTQKFSLLLFLLVLLLCVCVCVLECSRIRICKNILDKEHCRTRRRTNPPSSSSSSSTFFSLYYYYLPSCSGDA